jgi:hypothetical protein
MSEFATHEEWRAHCEKLAMPVLSELFGLYQKICDDPKPGQVLPSDVLSLKMVIHALEMRTGIGGWRCYRDGPRLVVGEPPRPIPLVKRSATDRFNAEVWIAGRRIQGMPVGHETFDSDLCSEKLACGGNCRLNKNHSGPHECPGDTDGPGSCPA